ncbi:MAG: ABC transporter ATP-binding protein [Actinomycetota bacterium]|nr:ABC transporter ATP-binding protein [Actinomycetota bacterium]
MSFGSPVGSPFNGPSAASTSAAAGLPFAGMPSELAERAEEVLADEPEHIVAEVPFSAAVFDREPFTLRRFLVGHRLGLLGAVALVIVETLTLQAGPLLTQVGLDRGIAPRNLSVLWWVGTAYLASVVLNAATSAWRVSYTGRLSERLMYELRLRVFSHFQRQSLDFFTEEKAGRLMTRMTSDVDALSALFQDGLVNFAVQGLTLVIITGVLFALNVELALVTLLVVIPSMGVLTIWFRGASERGYGRVRDKIAEVLSDLSESLAGIRVIAATNRQSYNVVQHANIVGEHRNANLYASTVGAVYGPANEAVGVLGQAVLLLVGGRMVIDGSLTVGELFAFLLYLTAFFAPIQQLVQLYTTYQQGQAAVVKLRDLLGTQPSTIEQPDAYELPDITGRIELRNVTFGYDPAYPVLHGLDLVIEPGETVAVVGPTGAGKSTVAKLVTRFYDPNEGSVLIDGHDLRDVTLGSLRRQLGVVPQEPFLFNGTIGENVAFGRPEASPEEIETSCRLVGLGDLIDRLDDGLDSLVHERGSSLSSGERQLLALARAFHARPRVLVLDEATSNLDLRSESVIERALDVVLEGRTAIVIAHRLATAMRADRIAVVDQGRVIELGSHSELLAASGAYARMFETWASHA